MSNKASVVFLIWTRVFFKLNVISTISPGNINKSGSLESKSTSSVKLTCSVKVKVKFNIAFWASSEI